MDQFLVVANIKGNLLAKDLVSYLNQIKKYEKHNLIVCPPSIYIPYFLKNNFDIGIQNVFGSGICTGEITPEQAASIGIKYVIVGHSDRRLTLNETDNEINQKIIKCLKCGLKVILCVGETFEERNMMKTTRVLKRQIQADLRGVDNLKNVMIAYEPVWAIGSGKTPSNQDIKDAATYIKEIVSAQNNYNDITVLYGGSVDDKNFELIKKIPNINGVLIGKMSLEPEKLLQMTSN